MKGDWCTSKAGKCLHFEVVIFLTNRDGADGALDLRKLV